MFWPLRALAAVALVAGVLPIRGQAQINLETSVPTNWSCSAGTLAISTNHFKLGAQALQWNWTANDIITVTNPGIVAADVTDFYTHTCDLWVHNPVGVSGQKLRFEFVDSGGTVQYYFDFYLDFTGWRRAVRSFKYDMKGPASNANFKQVRIKGPTTGAGQLFFDAVTWVGPRFTRYQDQPNSDIAGYMSSADTYQPYYEFTPDIAASSPTPAELQSLAILRTNWLAANAGTVPNSSTLTAAYSAWTNLSIISNAAGIHGDVISYVDTQPLESWVINLGKDVYWRTNAESVRKLNLLLRHLWDQGMDAGSGEGQGGGSQGYDFRATPTGLVLGYKGYDSVLRERTWQMLHWMYRMGQFWQPNPPPGDNTDDIYLTLEQQLGAVLFLTANDATAVQYLKGMQRYLDRFLTPSNGTDDAIKVDGVSFHHRTHYIAYMYALRELVDVLHQFRGTQFQVNSNAYVTLRGGLYSMLLMANNSSSATSTGQYANSLSGRHPFSVALPFDYVTLQRLGELGGEILGQSADPVVARAYNRLFGASYPFTLFTPFGSEPNPAGFYQFNYSPIGVFRQSNWVATVKAMGTNFWGSEIYVTENRYGRYTSYGALEVFYPGALEASGFKLAGWDWNKPPGTTTILLPWDQLIAEVDREDVFSVSNFSGALSFRGEAGLYACNFREVAKSTMTNHNGTFVWHKSWFCFSNQIVCLGSDITNNDTVNPTITTICQGVLTNTSRATVYNGINITAFPHTSNNSGAANRWLLDHLGTGYYVHAGAGLRISRGLQTSPDETGSGAFTSSNFATAWLDHGTAPAGASYEYVVIPGTSSSAMSQLAANYASPATTPYEVLQRDATAHIVRWKPDSRIGYALFQTNALATGLTNAGIIAAASRPCLIMTEANNAMLVLSVVDPSLNLVTNLSTPVNVDVVVLGHWRKLSGPAGASIVATGLGRTVIRVQVVHGLAAEVQLELNRAPLLSGVSNKTIPRNGSTGPISLTVSDDFTAAAAIGLSAVSSNTVVVPNSAILLGGSGSNRSVTVTPVGGQTGSVLVTLIASDGLDTTNTQFTVNVFDPETVVLSATELGTDLQLAWPANIGDWELLNTKSLTPPVVWQTNSVPPAFSNGQWTVLTSRTNQAEFYRIRPRQ